MTSLTTAVPDAHRREPAARAASSLAASAAGIGRAGGPGIGHRRLLVPVLDLGAAALVVLLLGVLVPQARDPLLVLATAPAWCVVLAGCGAWAPAGRTAGLRPVLAAGAVLGLALWLLTAAPVAAPAPAVQVALTGGLVLAAATIRLTTRGGPVPVAVAGDLADVDALIAELRRDRRPRWDVTTVCAAPDDPAALADPRLGADEVVESARATGARAVIVLPGRSLDPAGVRRTCWAAHEAGLDTYVGTGLLDVAPHRVRHVAAGTLGLAEVRSAARPGAARAAKHAADRVLAGIALVLLLPVLAGVALAIRCDSPGRVLYAQRRTGRTGTPFTMYKFRTMHTDADRLVATLEARNDCDGVLFKMREDPRITRVGRVLRRYSLDELPQLINVLRGDMSLVGPRPALPAEVARYETDPRRRLAVLPGLTGLWQVSGRSDLSWEESVRLDLHYVDNWSWTLDLRILVRTVSAVLGHRGAY